MAEVVCLVMTLIPFERVNSSTSEGTEAKAVEAASRIAADTLIRGTPLRRETV
ncbi:MAG: hypothetical protein BWX47_01901 [candidate division Hyd24-12 bacterium ADurb.Bin004]|nr:MAG: hypothetical protein BWX47_01901 [candidate division Hyd24-12 bacterium ADurb.Bin004]